jgi:tetratricopeptide (TPR) repeat protein
MEILRPLAIFTAMLGNFEAARTIWRRCRSLVEEFPAWAQEVGGWEARAIVEHLAGDLAAEEKALRHTRDMMIAMDDISRAVSILALLAQAAITRGDAVEGLSLSEESERLATAQDYDAQTRWRIARAAALARLGRRAEAETFAHDAVAVVSRTDDIDLHATALVGLAEVLHDRSEADEALETAIDLFDRKANLASATRARALSAARS